MHNNVVVCTDSNYSKYIPILFESLILNTTKDINFYVIYSSINEKDKADILTIVNQNSNNTVNFINFDFKKEVSKLGYTVDLPSFRGGFDTYSRLFLTSLLKDYNVETCLYMDVDIIINKNIDDIFSIMPDIKLIGGVIDTVTIDAKIPLSRDNYINAGVLLLNLKNLEQFDLINNSLLFAQNNFEKLTLGDQDIINNVFPEDMDYLKVIDPKYNMYYSKTSLVKSGVILHFTGPYKPWMPNCRWRLKKCIWAKYSLATKLLLKNWNITKSKVKLIGFIINCSRILLNLWLQIRIFLGIIKK